MPEDVSGEAEAGEEMPLLAVVLLDALDDGEDCVELFASVPPLSVDEVDESAPAPPPSLDGDELDEGALFDVTGPCVGLAPMVGLPPNRSLNGSLAAL